MLSQVSFLYSCLKLSGIGNKRVVKASCVLANMPLNKLLYVIGNILLQSFVIVNMLNTL